MAPRLMKGGYHGYNCKCECGWTGHEGELYRLQALMGDGYYPGRCPQCKAENSLFNTPIKTVDGYTLIVVPRKITKTTQYPPQTYEANIDTVSVRPVDWATYKSADGSVVVEW